MSGLQSIYGKLPLALQNVAVSLYGYRWKRRRFGGVFEAELKKSKEREKFSTQQWQSYQTDQLRRLLVHSFDTVPYYKDSFSSAGWNRSRLGAIELDALSCLPLLDKQDLRKFGTTKLISAKRERGGEFFASSGSTGTPTQILFSEAMHQRWSAGFEARIRHWAGVDRFTPRGMIGGRRVVPEGKASPPYHRYNLFEKQVYFSAYHISPQSASDYVQGIRRYGIQYMTGYAMSNYFLARFIREAGINAPRLKAVITSSEKLTEQMRMTFREVYDCKTFDSWSGVEACGLVSECEFGSLHISPDLGVIELVDENGRQVAPGEEGEVVCTGLINFDQPLIRYRIGDRMRLGSGNCPCGRAMPIIKEIVGRLEDTVIGKDGREIVRFHGIFVNLPNLVEAQVIQETLELLRIKVVTTGKWTEAEEATIRSRVHSQLGEVSVHIELVDSIPLTSNGKFKAVVSKVIRKH
jgi:phenylacetate-CoA ligase